MNRKEQPRKTRWADRSARSRAETGAEPYPEQPGRAGRPAHMVDPNASAYLGPDRRAPDLADPYTPMTAPTRASKPRPRSTQSGFRPYETVRDITLGYDDSRAIDVR